MANLPITGLPAAAALDGTELYAVSQGGTTKKSTSAAIATFINTTFPTGSSAFGRVAFWDGVHSVTGSSSLFWDSVNDRLGIGTATPDSFLHVQTAVGRKLVTSDANNRPTLTFNNAGTIGYIDLISADRFAIIAQSNVPLNFGTNNIDRVTITGAGNVGIGTTSPTSVALLDVVSTTQGVRFPRMTTAERTAIVTTNLPAIIVYDTDVDGLFCTNNAGNWIQL